MVIPKPSLFIKEWIEQVRHGIFTPFHWALVILRVTGPQSFMTPRLGTILSMCAWDSHTHKCLDIQGMFL